MKMRLLFFLLIGLLLEPFLCAATWERDWKTSIEGHHNEISGPGKASSFLTKDDQFFQRFMMNTTRKGDFGIGNRHTEVIGLSGIGAVRPLDAPVERVFNRTAIHLLVELEFHGQRFLGACIFQVGIQGG